MLTGQPNGPALCVARRPPPGVVRVPGPMATLTFHRWKGSPVGAGSGAVAWLPLDGQRGGRGEGGRHLGDEAAQPG